ncbi:MAG TPA: hypothetical protein VFG19_05635 [Geobacteraceae bacterium]|nr:hypothetical protein [Geobacteraceae bacterium]
MRKYQLLSIVMVSVAVLIFGFTSAHAAMSIDYMLGDVPGQMGQVVYNPGPGSDSLLHGINIPINYVTSTETPLNAKDNLAVTNGVLNFTTGDFSGKTGNVWTFNGGGTVTLTGGIPGLGLPDGTTLLTGTFTAANVTEYPLGQYSFKILGGAISGNDNLDVYSYYGIDLASIPSIATSLSFIATDLTGNGFKSTNCITGTVVDSPSAVPIPTALGLLGSGLTCFVLLRRRLNI